ncbi:MAG: FAD-dependent oxidoreductase [Anaerolineaceae bacterium]|nr:FAD-dependent oxidoreductase [Anaerolineaceae bacterium]
MVTKHFPYLIVGGGMTGDAAVRGIRKVDADGVIGMFSLENDPPYDRPPLSKGLWKGRPIERIWRKTTDFGIDLHLGRRVIQITAAEKQVKDNLGNIFSYDKLLLATGASPIRLASAPPGVIFYRTVDDYRRLRALTDQGSRFAVIGGGFIGSELAASLIIMNKEVSMIFAEDGIGEKVFPRPLSQQLNDFYRQKGVNVLAGRLVLGIEEKGSQYRLQLDNGQEIIVDGIAAGLGVRLNLELAEQAGLAVDNGIIVDPYMRTSAADIYAAGDVISFYNPTLDRRMRVEHEENANMTGTLAGLSMAGQPEPYNFLPSFDSKFFELGYEAVGETQPDMELVEDWNEPFPNGQGVIYYMKSNRVRGIVLWNIWQKLKDARQVIAEPSPFKSEDLKGRIKA